MNTLYDMVWVELRKAGRSKMPFFTTLGFMLAPLACALMMFIYKDPEFARQAGIISAKAELLGGTADWPFYMKMLGQSVSIGGLLLFSLVISWVFGREFVDGTMKDLMAVPLPRLHIVLGKFIVTALWTLGMVICITLTALLLGAIVDLPLGSVEVILGGCGTLLACAGMVLLTILPFAFLASAGRGYLLPMGIAILVLISANVLALMGWGNLFPWAIPAIFSEAGNQNAALVPASYVIVLLTGLAGVVGTALWWKYADQK